MVIAKGTKKNAKDNIQQAHKFSYLGQILSEDARCEIQI